MVDPISDKEWQEYQDARTLAEAQVINNDSQRLTAAKKMAARIAEEDAEKARAMKKVAGQRVPIRQKSDGSAQRLGNTTDPANPFNVFKRI